MKVFDYHDKQVKEVTDAQYDFMQVVIKNGGNLTATLNEYPIANEELEKWKNEPFWAILDSHILVLIKSKGLNADAVKEFYLDAMYGTIKPTREQIAGANGAAKLLMSAYSPRQGFKGSVTLTQDNVSIAFEDGLTNEQADNKNKLIP